MKRNLLKISVFSAVLLVIVSGCKNDELDPDKIADGKGQNVSFTLSGQTTRTVYGEKDEINQKWPIYWADKDSIRIYCNEAEDVTDAAYQVISTSLDGNSNKGTLNVNENGLKWGSDDGVHNFYAVYPNDVKKAKVENGFAYFALNYNQVCTITKDAVNGNYIAEPDMKNAFMVANVSTIPVEDVTLNFRPIMTTLDITVRGRATTNTGTITLTGISIINNSVNYSMTDDGFFQYDIKNNKLVTSSASEKGIIYTRLKNNINDKNEYHIDIDPGQSVTFTVFLPPVPINDANKIDVRVHATGETTYSVTVGGQDDANGKAIEYQPSSKGSLTLGWFPTTQNGNNWITPLDDDIYVSQLSIPGTHDAATKDAGYLINAGRCQDLTIEEQLNIGIRAFDLRPTTRSWGSVNSDGNKNLPIYHGATSCKTDMKTVFNTFNKYLDNNPGEFIIVTCRWENEADVHIATKWDTFNTCMTNFLNNEEFYPAKRKVSFQKDLTIGDMRNKILIIMRPNQGSSPDIFYADNALEGTTFISGWPAGGADVREGVYFKSQYEGSATGYAVIQDYYNPSDAQAKIDLVKKELDLSAKSHTDVNYQNIWFINHCSGYIGSAASYDAYSNNASETNPNIYNYLNGSEKPVGSTGIMMLDFVGKRVAAVSSMTVYGDLLPQAIIDNNYKYQMKKRTTNN